MLTLLPLLFLLCKVFISYILVINYQLSLANTSPAPAKKFLPQTPPQVSEETDPQREFDQFKAKFSRTYSGPEEEEARFAIFSAKLRRVEEHNAKPGVTHMKGILHLPNNI